jgi:hypothetical protein
MSIEFSKLNKPGSRTSLGKTGVTSQATRNLSGSTAAKNSSIFSLKGGHKTNFVAGNWGSVDISRYNYQGIRQSLNSRASSYPISSYESTSNTSSLTYSNNNSYLKGQILGQVANGLFGFLNNLVSDDSKVSNTGNATGGGSVKSSTNKTKNDKQNTVNDSPTSGLDNYVNSDDSSSVSSVVTSDDTASVISNMSACNDSASLRSSIDNAKGKLTTLEGKTAEYKTNAANAEKNSESLKSKVKTTKTTKDKANQKLSNAKNEVGIKTENRDSKQNDLQNANNEYGKAAQQEITAKDNYSLAQDNQAQAQATYDSLEDQIPDGNGGMKENPAKIQAKQRLDEAKQKTAEAKTQLEEATKAKEAAEKKVDKADDAFTKAKTALEESQKSLDQAKEKLKTAEEESKKAETDYENAKKELEDANGAITLYKEHKQDVEKLTSEIKKEQERLTKLEKQEQEKYDKLTKEIKNNVDKNTNREGKIDTSDGMNLKEKWLSRKMKKSNESSDKKLEEKEAIRDNVILTKLLNNGEKTVGSDHNTYAKLNFEGTIYYSMNNQLISEDEYKKALGLTS